MAKVLLPLINWNLSYLKTRRATIKKASNKVDRGNIYRIHLVLICCIAFRSNVMKVWKNSREQYLCHWWYSPNFWVWKRLTVRGSYLRLYSDLKSLLRYLIYGDFYSVSSAKRNGHATRSQQTEPWSVLPSASSRRSSQQPIRHDRSRVRCCVDRQLLAEGQTRHGSVCCGLVTWPFRFALFIE